MPTFFKTISTQVSSMNMSVGLEAWNYDLGFRDWSLLLQVIMIPIA